MDSCRSSESASLRFARFATGKAQKCLNIRVSKKARQRFLHSQIVIFKIDCNACALVEEPAKDALAVAFQ